MTTSAADLLDRFLDCTAHDIVPKTAAGVASGSKVFGAAIFKKGSLEPVIVETNHETASPLLREPARV
jgi:tRNA(Arg) A34 adenosine deaminase TadA